jgi:hypothetical protein
MTRVLSILPVSSIYFLPHGIRPCICCLALWPSTYPDLRYKAAHSLSSTCLLSLSSYGRLLYFEIVSETDVLSDTSWGMAWDCSMKSVRPNEFKRSLIQTNIILRGRVSKQITNGSKTAVMDVIGFLCVSLGNSTVQLHYSLDSRRACAYSEAGFSSQNSDIASECTHRRAAFCCAFFLGKKAQWKGYSQRNVLWLWSDMFVA